MAEIVNADSTNCMDRDIGIFASWSVSSSKPGFEVEQLTDPSTTTFWQSEGPQPHHINITFPRRMAIAQLSIFVDIGLDDSYTPQKISIRAGTFHGDLQEVKFVELDNPRGWVHFPLGSLAETDAANADELDYTDPEAHAIKANIIQLAILGNHLNGKDTHVRHVRIFAPKRKQSGLEEEALSAAGVGEWTTEVMKMHQTIR
ncbi:anaphase-promoting complex, subunit 10 [Cystobasidium minutum MCA 4210]|uniref:anaphase-promoting complex, subunit 10 n=1 Tax=Cystobasidium minutum MCA 4210 TaxID=1397322 RepID=UPI0034CF9B11|eukprot:jgi/Rhomi1/50804/CE50803_887